MTKVGTKLAYWTQEMQDELARLARDGVYAIDAAAQMTEKFGRQFNRVTVVSRARRTGLAFTSSRPEIANADRLDQRRQKKRLPKSEVLERSPPKPVPTFSASSADTKVNILDVGFGHCRAPLWGFSCPPVEEMFFCGAPTGAEAGWCEVHAAQFGQAPRVAMTQSVFQDYRRVSTITEARS